jgi:acyl-CoA thioesterase I
MRYALALILTLFCCGCRNDSPLPAGSAGSLRAPPPTADARPVIVAFGDSLTAGFGVDPGHSYPDFLQQDLDSRGYRYRVVNQGVSGDTTTDGVARAAMATAGKPAIIILELGANDGLRGLPVATTRANLDRLLRELRNSGATVVMAGITLPPNYGPDYIASFENQYRDLAHQHRVPLIPFLLEGVAGTTEFMQRDGLHPNVEGNRRVAATVMKTLEPLLHK